MNQVLKRYSLISFTRDDSDILYERIYVDPEATDAEHEAKLQLKLGEINAIYGVTKFTVVSTYEYEVVFVDETQTQEAPAVAVDGGNPVV